MNALEKMIASFWSLVRGTLSLGIACSGLAVFLYFRGAFAGEALAMFFGVWFCAASASAINQVLEQREDSLMERTRYRPLPAGRFFQGQAITVAVVLGALGCSLLFFGAAPLAMLLGAFAMAWYSVVYTPLKRRTPFALLAGALTGAIPPLIGCVAAGHPIDGRAFAIAGFMYLWQMPHFFLLLLSYRDEYKRAGFLTLSSYMGEDRLRQVLSIWTLATAASVVLFPLARVVSGAVMGTALLVLTCLFSAGFFSAAYVPDKKSGFKLARRMLYLFQGGILTVLVLEGFIG
jgi:heme o synthase